jgi:hypothetical protein
MSIFNIAMRTSDYRWEVGLVIAFITHLRNVTTSNYIITANSHTLRFSTASTKSSQSAVLSPVVS